MVRTEAVGRHQRNRTDKTAARPDSDAAHGDVVSPRRRHLPRGPPRARGTVPIPLPGFEQGLLCNAPRGVTQLGVGGALRASAQDGRPDGCDRRGGLV